MNKRNPTKKEAHFMAVTIPAFTARLNAAAERGDLEAIEEIHQELADAFRGLPIVQEAMADGSLGNEHRGLN